MILLIYHCSSLLVEFFIHDLDRLHQLVAVLGPDPFFEGSEDKFSIFFALLEPVEVVGEDLLSVFLLEDAVDQVAAEELQLDLTSEGDVLGDFFVSLAEDMAHH